MLNSYCCYCQRVASSTPTVCAVTACSTGTVLLLLLLLPLLLARSLLHTAAAPAAAVGMLLQRWLPRRVGLQGEGQGEERRQHEAGTHLPQTLTPA